MEFRIVIVIDPRGASRSVDDLERRLDRLEKRGQRAGREISRVLGALVTAATIRGVASLADQYTTLQNKLRTVTSNSYDLANASQRTFKIAQENRVEWGAVANTYARVSKSVASLGLHQTEVAEVVDSFSKAIQLSGSTTQETNAVLIQLSQALSSGKLAGDEFRSVMENATVVGDVLAKSLKVTRGQLRALSKEGKLTSDVIITAFQKARGELVEQFGKSVPTISQRIQQLKNELVRLVGEGATTSGALRRVGEVIGFVTKNLDVLVEGLVYLSVTVLTVKLVQGAATAVKALNALRLAMLANPALAIAAGITTLAVALSQIETKTDAAVASLNAWEREGLAGFEKMKKALADAEMSIRRTRDALRDALDVTAFEQIRISIRETVDAVQAVQTIRTTQARLAAPMTLAATAILIETTEKYNRALKAFQALEGSLFSQVAARNKIIEAERELTEALKQGIVTRQRVGEIERALVRSLFDQLEPTQALIKELNREISLYALANREREIEREFRIEALRLQGMGIELTKLEAQEIRALIALKRDLAAQEAGGEELRSFTEGAFGRLADADRRQRGRENRREQRLADRQRIRPLGEGFRSGLQQLNAEIFDTASLLESTLVNAFHSAEDALVEFVTTGEFSFSRLVDSILADLTRLAVRQALVAGISAIAGAPMPLGAGGGLGGAGLPGFRDGVEDARVGGSGGPDSQIVAFRASPDETITVRTPEQRRRERRDSRRERVEVVLVNDPRGSVDALKSRRGTRTMVNVLGNAPGARQLLR